MVNQSTATALPFRHDNLYAETRQQTNRRSVDARVEDALGTAGEDRNPAVARSCRRMHRRSGDCRNRRHGSWRKVQHGAERSQCWHPFQETGERTPEPRKPESGAEPCRIRKGHRQHGAGQPVHQRAAIGLFDVNAGMIDQMHVVDAGGTGRRAGKAGKTAVDMGHQILVGRPAVFQHVLDEVDTATRAVQFVAERHIGGTGGRAEPAMDAFTQNALRLGDMRIRQLFCGEIGLHVLPPGGRRLPRLAPACSCVSSVRSTNSTACRWAGRPKLSEGR